MPTKEERSMEEENNAATEGVKMKSVNQQEEKVSVKESAEAKEETASW